MSYQSRELGVRGNENTVEQAKYYEWIALFV